MSSLVNTALIPGSSAGTLFVPFNPHRWTWTGLGFFLRGCFESKWSRKVWSFFYYGRRTSPIQVYGLNETQMRNFLESEASLGSPHSRTSTFCLWPTPVPLSAAAPLRCISTCSDIMTRSFCALSTRPIVAPYRCETQPTPRCKAFLQAFVPRHSWSPKTLLSKRNPVNLLRG